MATTCSQLPQTWDRRRGILASRGKTLLRCAVYRRAAASVSISPPPVLALDRSGGRQTLATGRPPWLTLHPSRDLLSFFLLQLAIHASIQLAGNSSNRSPASSRPPTRSLFVLGFPLWILRMGQLVRQCANFATKMRRHLSALGAVGPLGPARYEPPGQAASSQAHGLMIHPNHKLVCGNESN